jgi:hypothetical protein
MVPTAVLGIVAAYVVLAVLLLSLNIASLWRWQVKAAAILVSAVFFVSTSQSINGLMGWPTGERPPPRFSLTWSVVVEPDKKTNDPGHIYLWAQDLDGNNVARATPRSYQLPYSDALARNVSHAQEMRDRGVDVMGHVYDREAEAKEPRADIKMSGMEKAKAENGYSDAVPFLEDGSRMGFEELPPIVLPDKGPL